MRSYNSGGVRVQEEKRAQSLASKLQQKWKVVSSGMWRRAVR
jgi:hypothetical protein